MPRTFTQPVCSWCALFAPPLMQLVQSSHASSVYSTRVLLTRTTRTAVDATCAIFARLEPLLDPCTPGAHYSYRRGCSLWSFRTLRAFARPVCSWRALLVPSLMQLVQSSHASSLYSTRVILARTPRTPVDAACALFDRLGSLLDPGSLAGTNSPPMLQLVQSPNASGPYSTRIPWQARTVPPMLQLVW